MRSLRVAVDFESELNERVAVPSRNALSLLELFDSYTPAPTGCSAAHSQQYKYFVLNKLAPRAGFEPATLRLTG